MPQSRLITLATAGATAGSAALLLGALGFQYFGGLFPCELCLWQRWPHVVAVVFGIMTLAWPGRRLIPVLGPLLGAAAVVISAAIAGFHVGVEQGWWEGLASCGGAGIAGLSTAALLDPAAAAPAPIRCDRIAWAWLGISMAGWNLLLSLGLAGLWLTAARRHV